MPKTEAAVAGKKRKWKEVSAGIKRRRDEERLTVYEVCKIIQAKSISTRLELVCLATAQEREGKLSLAQFIANRGHKAVDEALTLAKEFSTAESLMGLSKKTRVQILQEAKESDCVMGCAGEWFEAAHQVLANLEITPKVSCGAVYEALSKGRGNSATFMSTEAQTVARALFSRH